MPNGGIGPSWQLLLWQASGSQGYKTIYFFLILTSGINDVSGVCVGGVLGHFICTGLAVICGALIAKKVSVRVVTLVGALVFIGFAVASLFIDPYEENHLVPDVDVSYTFGFLLLRALVKLLFAG